MYIYISIAIKVHFRCFLETIELRLNIFLIALLILIDEDKWSLKPGYSDNNINTILNRKKCVIIFCNFSKLIHHYILFKSIHDRGSFWFWEKDTRRMWQKIRHVGVRSIPYMCYVSWDRFGCTYHDVRLCIYNHCAAVDIDTFSV